MNALRWMLGLIAALFAGGYVALVLMANAFRRSVGASANGPLFIVLPVLGIALLLAAILFPSNKPLLHGAALAAVGLAGFCLWQIFRDGAAPLWFAVVYLAAWFVFYGLAAWRVAQQP